VKTRRLPCNCSDVRR